MIYLVNHKLSSCLWAPRNQKKHAIMRKIRKGDIFLNNAGSKTIKGISIAEGDCEEVDDPEKLPSPPEGCKPGEQIYWVPVSCYELFHPIRSAALEPKQGKYVQEVDLDTAQGILEEGVEERQLPEVQKILKGALNMMKSNKGNNNDRDYINLVKSAKNVIFHGAPGTGKTYLAKQIAAKIVSNGCCNQCDELENLQNQVGFVQFYPGYDYSNFVEGYKPSANNSELDFSLVPGIFKTFVSKAREGLEAYERLENLRKEASPDLSQAVVKRLQQCVESNRPFWTYRSTPFSGEKNKFHISKLDSSGEDVRVTVASTSVQDGEINFKLSQLLAGPGDSKNNNFGINEEKNTSNLPSYMRPVWDFLFTPPTFVFIIDEINRGNTSGIFGELFYAIDPGNRGPEGEVTLQYSKEKFYVPDNVLLIGTMNDIDRSVEPFDFAFRRRWNFKEIKPEDTSGSILDSLVKEDPKLSKDDITKRMDALNKVISQEIGEDYQIGAAYFLKLENLNNDFKHLWDYDLFPLLKEYVHGMDNEKDLLEKFQHAYYGENQEEN